MKKLEEIHVKLATMPSDTIAHELIGGIYRVFLTLLLAPFVAVAIGLAVVSYAPAQDFVPTVTGDGVKTVIQVSSLPFKVSGPPGGLLYGWKVPAGVVADDNFSQDLTITAAPQGEMKINVVMVTLDAMNKPVRKNGTVTVMLGATPQPPVIPPSTKVTYAFVVESAVPDSSTAIWLEDAATWTPLGLTMHKIYHPGDALPAGLGERAAQAGGYPALVLCGAADATGALKFIDAVPLPKSAADTQAKIRTYGSK